MARYHVDIHLDPTTSSKVVQEDIRRGLTGHPKSLPPKYFYDSLGSALFERITQLPEYYLTRVELQLIAEVRDELMEQVSPEEIVELGAGSSTKIRQLLDASYGVNSLARYLPVDVDQGMIEAAAQSLTQVYPFLQVYGVVGDFEHHLDHLPPPTGRRLILFLGSTIGNLDPPARHDFLVRIRQLLATDDRLLLGVDLVKDHATLEAAYNDAQGVTAQFNRNILRVVNQAVHADFQPEAFHHSAFYNQEAQRIEMHLVPSTPQTIHLLDLALSINVSPQESIWTESSYKFTQGSTLAMLEEAGLQLERWYTDSNCWFTLVLACPR